MKTIDIIGWGLFLIIAGFAIGELSYWLEHFRLIPTIAAGIIFAVAVNKMGLIKQAPKKKSAGADKRRRNFGNAQNQNHGKV